MWGQYSCVQVGYLHAPLLEHREMLTLFLFAVLGVATTEPHYYQTFDPVSGISAHGPTIVLLSAKDELSCDLWWVANEVPLKTRGWQVHEVTHVKPRQYPSFRIYFNGKWRTHEGPLYKSTLQQIVGVPVM